MTTIADLGAEVQDRVTVKLVGEDGNVFAVIGNVRRALIDAGQGDEAAEFVAQAFNAGSYDEVLDLVLAYVEVE